MKTKEQKRIEATQRHHNHLKRILKVGEEAYLLERLSKSEIGKKEKERLSNRLINLIIKESQKTMSVKELKSESKKSKGGK